MNTPSPQPSPRGGEGAYPLWKAALFLLLFSFYLLPAPSQAITYPLPHGSDVVGAPATDTARDEDTLMDIARVHNVGYQEIRLANPGVDVWIPGEGTPVAIPIRFVLPDAPREGIVINLAERRLYYYPPADEGGDGDDAAQVVTHPIGIGRLDRQTPTATTSVTHKLDDPAWYPTPDVRADYASRGEKLPAVIPPGPDNPLGEHALILALDGYLIHGTNHPDGIGMRVSQGCIRLYPEDIETLIQQVSIGTPVHIVDQPVKVGIHGDRLYVEVHPLFSEEEESDLPDMGELVRQIDRLMQVRGYQVKGGVDWERVDVAFGRADGIPVDVTSDWESLGANP